MTVRYKPQDDWFVEEYSECQKCGEWKEWSTGWYCKKCDKEIYEKNKLRSKCHEQ